MNDRTPFLPTQNDVRHRRRSLLLGAALTAVALVAAFDAPAARGTPPVLNNGSLIGPIDEDRVAAAGIRKLAGTRLVLYTDLPLDSEIRELPLMFAEAYDQWCVFFGRPDDKHKPWQMRGFLMADRQRFRQAGVLPADSIVFLNGYASDTDLWLDNQPTSYYRRHLLLHEGTHGFMLGKLGSCGPPWMAEGLAELLGTHRWVDGKLTMGIMPRSREEAPLWGRTKAVRDEIAAGRSKTIDEVLAYDTKQIWGTDQYSWSWALATLLKGTPRYKTIFPGLIAELPKGEITGIFRARTRPEWHDLLDDWAELTTQLEYGYDLQRGAIEFAPGAALPAAGAQASVASDRGWQSTRIALEAGKRYKISASGQFTLAQQPRPWISEAGGVSIRYHAGRPLGMLLAVVRYDERSGAASPFAQPLPIGTEASLESSSAGTLYLKINDAPAERADNVGSLRVTVVETDK